MDNKGYIRMINGKCIDFHNRCNEAIEELIRDKSDGKEIVNRMIGSIQYICEDIERIINR